LNTGDRTLQIVCVFIPPAPADYIRENIEAAGAPGAEGSNG